MIKVQPTPKLRWLFFTFFIVSESLGQQKLPVIYANSLKVSIDDGGYLDKNAWTLSPETKPDIYTADRSRTEKWVIFYTDIDSIKVKVTPGSIFDFVVLLNGKDSCYTQIASSIALPKKNQESENKHDTIPFVLTEHNAIKVMGIINKTDTLNLHLDLSTSDFRITKEAILNKTKLLSNQSSAIARGAKPNLNDLEKVFQIQIGSLVWYNPDVRPANNAAHDMDGRFGWRVFDGKIIEIDYDKSLLIIHSSLPKIENGFVKSRIKFIKSLLCVEAVIKIKKKKYKGDFLFDTGSNLNMILDSAWASMNQFPEDLKLIKTSSFFDGTGSKYETKIVSVTEIQLHGYDLKLIPTSLLGNKSPVGFNMNYFGNGLLKRFNTIVDLTRDEIYLKPNKLFNLPYKVNE